MMRLGAWLVSVWLGAAAATAGATAQERVEIPGPDGLPVLIGYLMRPATVPPSGKTPAIVALHGCGGLFSQRDTTRLSERHDDWGRRWTAQGYAVLFADSFGSRGHGSLCRVKDRGITPRQRAQDAFAAAQWLANQSTIDAARIALVGWSNGASTALHANDAALASRVDFSTVIAFYPGCRLIAERATWKPRRPMTILIGAADDWTPAAPCRQLAAGTGVALKEYPDAYHDFDAPKSPLRRRTGLAFSASGDGTAHTGTNEAARAAAIIDVTRILDGAFK